jgi:glutamate--cysteine ligase
MHELAKEVVELAAAGLTARGKLNASGDNEGGFLDPLRDVLASGMTPADRLLEKYHNDWGGDVRRIYGELSF